MEGSTSSDPEDAREDWALFYPDEIKPSDSASRPKTSRPSRRSLHSSHSASGHRHSSKSSFVHEQDSLSHQSHSPSPESPESVDSEEEYGGPHVSAPQGRRFIPLMPQAPYSAYPQGGPPPGPMIQRGGPHPPSDQLVRMAAHPGQIGHQISPYGHHPYAYTSPFQHVPGSSFPAPFIHENGPRQQASAGRHAPNQQAFPVRDGRNFRLPISGDPYGVGLPAPATHDLVPYNPGSFYNFRDPYALAPGIGPPYFGSFSPQLEKSSQPADGGKDEAIERLEKLILEERTAREARQAAAEKAAAEKTASEERAAHEKKIADTAAAKARADAEAQAKTDAEKQVAEATAKAKKEGEEAAAAANKNPKKKPIKFKDAIGRKFSFPFDLCCTWKVREYRGFLYF